MKNEKRAAKPDAAEVLAEKQARDAYRSTVKQAREKCRADIKAAKKRLAEALDSKSTECRRNLMRENHKFIYNRDLEKDPRFMGWLGKRDWHGHEMYALECSYCRGDGKDCGRCRGTGQELYPRYCKDCDCMLPHPPGVACYH